MGKIIGVKKFGNPTTREAISTDKGGVEKKKARYVQGSRKKGVFVYRKRKQTPRWFQNRGESLGRGEQRGLPNGAKKSEVKEGSLTSGPARPGGNRFKRRGSFADLEKRFGKSASNSSHNKNLVEVSLVQENLKGKSRRKKREWKVLYRLSEKIPENQKIVRM